ncbi:unnamed protein product [Rotaria sp. Silwood1]|nr:unnamed protein product [Rotaria sp. Silwood1]
MVHTNMFNQNIGNNGKEYENEYQQNNNSRQRNGHENSSKNLTTTAPNLDDLGEYPLFSNGLTLSADDNSSQVHQTTVNTIPVIWGPQKRNK